MLRGSNRSTVIVPPALPPVSAIVVSLSSSIGNTSVSLPVTTACEKVLFSSADSVAAAVSYTAARVTRLMSLGDVAAANRNLTPDIEALRRSIQRDRYGFVAYVLAVRDHCQPANCAAYRSVTDHNQIASNMEERIYDGLVLRYSGSWKAPLMISSPTTASGEVEPAWLT